MTKTTKATAELVKLTAELPSLIEALDVEIQNVSARMAELEKEGLIYASEHWRKDDKGEPKYFYLLYPQQPGESRKREYIGCDEKRIEAARAAIARAKEFDRLNATLSSLNGRVHQVAQSMQEARRHLQGRQW